MVLQLRQYSSLLLLMAAMTSTAGYSAQPLLPSPESSEFCQRAQQLLAGTLLLSDNSVFANMAEYRHSKPMIDP